MLEAPLLVLEKWYPSCNIVHLAGCRHALAGDGSLPAPVFHVCILQNTSVAFGCLANSFSFPTEDVLEESDKVKECLVDFYCQQFKQPKFQDIIRDSLARKGEGNQNLVHFLIIAAAPEGRKKEGPCMIVAAASAYVHHPARVYLKWIAVSGGHMGPFFGPKADGLSLRQRELGTYLLAAVQALACSLYDDGSYPLFAVEVDPRSQSLDFYMRNGFDWLDKSEGEVSRRRFSSILPDTYMGYVLTGVDNIEWLQLDGSVEFFNPAVFSDPGNNLSWLHQFAKMKLPKISTDFPTPFLRNVVSLVRNGPPVSAEDITAAQTLFSGTQHKYQEAVVKATEQITVLREEGRQEEADDVPVPVPPPNPWYATQKQLRELLSSNFDVIDYGSGRNADDNDCLYEAFVHLATPYADDIHPEVKGQKETAAERVRLVVAKVIFMGSRLPDTHPWWQPVFLPMVTGLCDNDVAYTVALKREESFLLRGHRGLDEPALLEEDDDPEQCLEIFRFTSPPPIHPGALDFDLDHRATCLAYSSYAAIGSNYKGDFMVTLLATIFGCNICVLEARLGERGWAFTCSVSNPIPFHLDPSTGQKSTFKQEPFEQLDANLETIVLLRETLADGGKHFIGLTEKRECSHVGNNGNKCRRKAMRLVACLVCLKPVHYTCCVPWVKHTNHVRLLDRPHPGARLLVCKPCNALRYRHTKSVTEKAKRIQKDLSQEAARSSLDRDETEHELKERKRVEARQKDTLSDIEDTLSDIEDAQDIEKMRQRGGSKPPPEDGEEEDQPPPEDGEEEEREDEDETAGREERKEEAGEAEEEADAEEEAEDSSDDESDPTDFEQDSVDSHPDDVVFIEEDADALQEQPGQENMLLLQVTRRNGRDYNIRVRPRSCPDDVEDTWHMAIEKTWVEEVLRNWNLGHHPKHEVLRNHLRDWVPRPPIEYTSFPGFLYSIRCTRIGRRCLSRDFRSREFRYEDKYEGLRYNGPGHKLTRTSTPTWWVKTNFSKAYRQGLKQQLTDPDLSSTKYTKCPAGEARDDASLPPHLAPTKEAPVAIFQQSGLPACALCSLGNILYEMKCYDASYSLLGILEEWSRTGDPPVDTSEQWLKAFISTEQSLKKLYQPKNTVKNYPLLLPLPRSDPESGREGVENKNKNKRKRYTPKNSGAKDIDEIRGELGSMIAVSATEGISWEDYNTPMVLVLRGKDNYTGHSVATWKGWLFDSNVSRALKLNRETLDWCSGGRFHSADRGYRVAQIERTRPLKSKNRPDK